MAFQPIEEMRVYQRAEAIADEVWSVAVEWPYFVQRSVGCNWCVQWTPLAPTSLKVWAVSIPKMGASFFTTLADLYAKQFSGFAAPEITLY